MADGQAGPMGVHAVNRNGLEQDEPTHLITERVASLDWLVGSDPYRASATRVDQSCPLPVPVDWHALFARAADYEWTVDGFWPAGRQLHIFAARKTGKSLLMLWIAASLAAGRDPFTGSGCPAHTVVYLDYEMSEQDLVERVEEMGFEPDDLVRLRYYLYPPIPALDSREGGQALLDLVDRDGADIVVIDTVSRVVAGEENSADTFRALWRHTGSLLKAGGVGLARLDHEGHTSGRSRGSSAKADDVDIVWRLTAADAGGFRLHRQAARLAWVADQIELVRTEPHLGYRRSAGTWPAGTKALADHLTRLSVPIAAGRPVARTALKDAGIPARTEVLAAALRYRRSRDSSGTGPFDPLGQPSGTGEPHGL